MKLLKNPALRRELIVLLAAAAVFSAAAAFLSPSAGALTAGLGLFAAGAHLLFARRRYREMARLSEELDRILHRGGDALLEDSAEGELSLLKSEIKKLVVRLRENAAALTEERDRLSAATADLSHQLRVPLTALALNAELLSEADLAPERRLALTRDLKRQLAHMNWLVETLLRLARLDAGSVRFRRDELSAAELVRRAAEPLAIPLELRNVALDVSAGDERLTGDLFWTAEALGNVLRNAVEHTPAGGRIEVAARETPLFTELTVRDTGPGFAPEDLPRLFERFYRGRGAAPESVGIGLALAREIAAAQNGTLSAENARNGGALFTFRFYKTVV